MCSHHQATRQNQSVIVALQAENARLTALLDAHGIDWRAGRHPARGDACPGRQSGRAGRLRARRPGADVRRGRRRRSHHRVPGADAAPAQGLTGQAWPRGGRAAGIRRCRGCRAGQGRASPGGRGALGRCSPPRGQPRRRDWSGCAAALASSLFPISAHTSGGRSAGWGGFSGRRPGAAGPGWCPDQLMGPAPSSRLVGMVPDDGSHQPTEPVDHRHIKWWACMPARPLCTK